MVMERSRDSVIIIIYYVTMHFNNYVFWGGFFLYHIMPSLLLRVQASRSQVCQELTEREDVEKELSLVKGWIQDTRDLLLSPTADLESLLQELEVGYNGVITHINYALH